MGVGSVIFACTIVAILTSPIWGMAIVVMRKMKQPPPNPNENPNAEFESNRNQTQMPAYYLIEEDQNRLRNFQFGKSYFSNFYRFY